MENLPKKLKELFKDAEEITLKDVFIDADQIGLEIQMGGGGVPPAPTGPGPGARPLHRGRRSGGAFRTGLGDGVSAGQVLPGAAGGGRLPGAVARVHPSRLHGPLGGRAGPLRLPLPRLGLRHPRERGQPAGAAGAVALCGADREPHREGRHLRGGEAALLRGLAGGPPVSHG